MKRLKLKNETIRVGVACGPGFGYLFLADLAMEQGGDPFTKIVKLKNGRIEEGECNYDVVSACWLSDPSIGILDIAEDGDFSFNSRSGLFTGNVFATANNDSTESRTGGFRSVSTIAGRAHAVGYEGLVFRLDAMSRWSRIDLGVDPEFNAEAIDGFGSSDLYVVGENGAVFHLAGSHWTRIDLPSNANWNAVKCAPDGKVYLAGSDGVTAVGRGDRWSLFDERDMDEEIWSLAWFEGRMFASTFEGVFEMSGTSWRPVAIDGRSDRSCYRLSAAEDILWSIGETEVWQFDGGRWSSLC